MSGFRASDERLRQAFQQLGPDSAGECSEQDLDRIWRAISGELPASERRELIDRVAADPACAEAWRVARELWESSQDTVSPTLDHRRRFRVPSWLAAAAVLFLGVGVGLIFWLNRPPQDVLREQSGQVVESLVATDETLPRDAFRLRWTPGPAGSRYQVRVTTEDLRPLAAATDLTEPEFVVERGQLTPVPAGGRVLWQVEVTPPGGDTIMSQTFVTRAR